MEDVAYLAASRYRRETLKTLASSKATPSGIAREAGIKVAHVSRALGQLRDRDLVELLVPSGTKKGRIYGITAAGEEVLEELDEVLL